MQLTFLVKTVLLRTICREKIDCEFLNYNLYIIFMNIPQKPKLVRMTNTVYMDTPETMSYQYDAYLESLYQQLQLSMIEEENNREKDIETFGELLVDTVTYEDTNR